MLNTGRGLMSLKSTCELLKNKAPELFKGVRVDALAINNGQMLFLNPKGKGLFEWIASLSPPQQDESWRAAQQALSGWDAQQVRLEMEKLFDAEGLVLAEEPGGYQAGKKIFKTILPGDAQGRAIWVDCYPDQPGFRLRVEEPATGILEPLEDLTVYRFGKMLQGKLAQTLRQKGWQLETKETAFRDAMTGKAQRVFVLCPKGITKASCLDYALREKAPQSIQAVITAGDDPYNDAEMLSATLANGAGQPLPNYPIAVGGKTGLVEIVSNNPLAVQVAENQLIKGLLAQWRRIQALLKANRAA